MKLALLSAILGSAAAFAPAPVGRVATSVSETKADLQALAAKANPAIKFFDPLNLAEAEFWGTSNEATIGFLRESEVKHGRIAMLAVTGYLVTYAGVRFPGAEDIPSGFAALDALPGMVWAQMIATWAMMEAANQDQYAAPWGMNQNSLGESPAEFKGDFRNGALDFGWDKLSAETKLRKRAIELNNGRAAQMGILALMVHEKLGNVDVLLPLGPH